MKPRWLILIALLGVLLAGSAAYVFGLKQKALPPAFTPAANPYANGIYAEGILESDQSSGANVMVYPEVPGTVVRIQVKEGDVVRVGQTLFSLDDSVQRANLEQTRAQIELAEANLKTTEDSYQKLKTAFDLDPGAVVKETLDSAKNAVASARANVLVAQKQYQSALTLLSKYEVKALSSGTVLAINIAPGSYISAQGVYDTYTAQTIPALIMGSNPSNSLAVRCYVDEVLLERLPKPQSMKAVMFIRGSKLQVPLTFTRIQPNVTPKIELSDQRQERVDVRVLPIFFKFDAQSGMTLYPGQLVDVYIGDSSDMPPPH